MSTGNPGRRAGRRIIHRTRRSAGRRGPARLRRRGVTSMRVGMVQLYPPRGVTPTRRERRDRAFHLIADLAVIARGQRQLAHGLRGAQRQGDVTEVGKIMPRMPRASRFVVLASSANIGNWHESRTTQRSSDRRSAAVVRTARPSGLDPLLSVGGSLSIRDVTGGNYVSWRHLHDPPPINNVLHGLAVDGPAAHGDRLRERLGGVGQELELGALLGEVLGDAGEW